MHYNKEKNVFYAKNHLYICAILFYFHFFAFDFIILDKKIAENNFCNVGKNHKIYWNIFKSETPQQN